ncbi:hypothetical protein CF326_g5555, partial [Tilletia indica]
MPSRLNPNRRVLASRDREVLCFCHRRCTGGSGPPRHITARTRDAHLAADRADLQHSQDHDIQPPPSLVQAIRNNEVAITAEAVESDSSSTSSSSSSSSSEHSQDGIVDMDAEQEPLPPSSPLEHHYFNEHEDDNFDFGNQDLPSSPFVQPVEDDDDSSTAPSSSDSSDNPTDDDDDGLLAEQLHQFDVEFNSDEEDEHEGDEDLDEDGDQGNGGREGDEDRDEDGDPVEDPGTQSRHNQPRFDQLAGDHQPGPRPQRAPERAFSAFSIAENLTASEKATLDHLRTSIRTDATLRQYKDFGRARERDQADVEIFGKDRALSLMKRVTNLREDRWDMCPNSCMAFVGPNAQLQRCTTVRKGRVCGAARFDARGRPIKQFVTIPFLPRIKAKFAAGRGSTYIHDRAQHFAETWDTPHHRFQDWSDGAIHRHLKEKGLFTDPRHDAFILSTDGAHMTDKRDSNAWIVLLTSLSTPIELRFRRTETFISTVVPGPNNPIDLDSFLWPILEEFAQAARGFWLWDGARREWFLWRCWLVAAAADQPASSKLNHMTGATGKCGCKTCHMIA